jgi:hypothetical protein
LKAKTPSTTPTPEKRLRHATHRPDSDSMNRKSRLNWPGQAPFAMSPKKIG